MHNHQSYPNVTTVIQSYRYNRTIDNSTIETTRDRPYHSNTLKPGCKGGVCLVGEKPDKELPGIGGARGDTV